METKEMSYDELVNVIINGNVEDVYNALGPIDVSDLMYLRTTVHDNSVCKDELPLSKE